jgi:hypothetical protein
MSAVKPIKVNSSTGDYADFQSGDYVAPAQGGLGTSTAPASNGQIPIATSSNVYTPATLTAGTGVTITNASGSVTIAAGVQWSLQSESSAFSANAASGTFYQITASSALAVTLPSTPANGTVYKFIVISGTGIVTCTSTSPDTILYGPQSLTSITIQEWSGVMELTAVSGGWQVS